MPAPTYRIDEIVRLTGLPARTVRYYVERGLLPGPKPRGVGTRYTHEQLVRLRAITHLRENERLRLAAIKRRLSPLSAAEIEALVPPPSAPPAEPAPITAATAPPTATLAATALPAVYQRWDYIELIPGLELRIRSDAGPVLQRLAQEIHAQYAAAVRAKETPST